MINGVDAQIIRSAHHLASRMKCYLSKERLAYWELRRKLRGCPARVGGKVSFWQYNWQFVDAPSFLSAFRTVMVDRCYEFRSSASTEQPDLILDCGANIGLATLHFKMAHPTSDVIAFEPDPGISSVLRANVAANKLHGVQVVEAALWATRRLTVPFLAQQSDAGRVDFLAHRTIEVTTVSLRDYLAGPVSLLKMDIEGAEVDVLRDSCDLLGNVRNLVLEYHSFVGERERLAELLDTIQRAGFRTQINNIHRWMNPLIQSPKMDNIDQLLIIYGYRG